MKSIVFILLTSLPILLNGQDEPSAKETLLRFTSMGLSEQRVEYVLSTGKKQTPPFVIPDNGFSVPVSAPRSKDPIMLGKNIGDTFQGLANINLSEAGKRFLVILFPNQKDTMRAVVIRADDPAFLPGNIMIFNLANQTLAADLGGEKLTFAPSSQTIFRPTRKDDLANYQVKFYQEMEGKAKLFAANLWPYFDEKRAFVFLYVDPASGAAKYHTVDEFTSWIEPPADKLEAAKSVP